MAQRVVVCINVTGPIAGLDIEARPSGGVSAQPEVAAERNEILWPTRRARRKLFQRIPERLVKGGPSPQRHVFVDDLANQSMTEPETAAPGAVCGARQLLNEFLVRQHLQGALNGIRSRVDLH